MSRTISYSDAARILGSEGESLRVIDRLAGGLLLGLTGIPDILGWFDAKGEASRISSEVVKAIRQRRTGANRASHIEKLRAAHGVLVMSAFFDTLAELTLPFDAAKLDLDRGLSIRIATDNITAGSRGRDLVKDILDSQIPMPSVSEPGEAFASRLESFYRATALRMRDFISGLAVWDELNDTEQNRVTQEFASLPIRARFHYQEAFLQLAGEFPEVTCWANLGEHATTHFMIQELERSLSQIQRILGEGRAISRVWIGIQDANRAALQQPVANTSDADTSLRIPCLADAYIDPTYRFAAVEPNSRIASSSFWNERDSQGDLAGFLIGALISPEAASSPVLVLGQPGSGKSVLTKVLAARLPHDRFSVVRVALRDVPADASVQEQIEYSIKLSTGRNVDWTELSDATEEATPVILLDGFDELLQATGVSQNDYLLRLAEFQRREAIQGRPAIAIVTSRVTVADRAQLPGQTIVIHLDPFNVNQVQLWVQTWNDLNWDHFRAAELQPFSLGPSLIVQELARQPLLLLMLALYDSVENSLQVEAALLSEADLYEALLTRFVRREVQKDRAASAATTDQVGNEVNDNLQRLSVAAFAMFNRNTQHVTHSGLNEDLLGLLGTQQQIERPETRRDFRVPLSVSEQTIGSFYFVQQARAVSGGTEHVAYEFLHATFGEYLIARLTLTEICLAASLLGLRSRSNIGREAIDGTLFRLLSFATLSVRAPVLGFLRQKFDHLATNERSEASAVVRHLLLEAICRDEDPPLGTYSPQSISSARRRAVYVANLILLTLVVGPTSLSLSQLFSTYDEPIQEWRRWTLLWKSQLRNEEWLSLLSAMRLTRVHREEIGVRDGLLEASNEGSRETFESLAWSIDLSPQYASEETSEETHAEWTIWENEFSSGSLRRSAAFLSDPLMDYAMHCLEPLLNAVGDLSACRFETLEDVPLRVVNSRSVVRTIADAVTAPLEPDPSVRSAKYREALESLLNLTRMVNSSPAWQDESYSNCVGLFLTALAADSLLPSHVKSSYIRNLIIDPSVHISPSHIGAAIRISLSLVTGEDSTDRSTVLPLLGQLFGKYTEPDPPSFLREEAWLLLAELGYVNFADWSWTDASLGARHGRIDSRLQELRPDLMRRLLFVAQAHHGSQRSSSGH